ncbi:Uncharacterised protein [Vibrio cholerae]|nr:Uncharacterised protein [Vibrio cholerae]
MRLRNSIQNAVSASLPTQHGGSVKPLNVR